VGVEASLEVAVAAAQVRDERCDDLLALLVEDVTH